MLSLMWVWAYAGAVTLTLEDARHHQTVSVTPVSDDIVRVDVVPAKWSGTSLPSLALDKTMGAADVRATVTDLGGGMKVLTTAGGLRVVADEQLGSLTMSCGDTFYVTDLCRRDGDALAADFRDRPGGPQRQQDAGARELRAKRAENGLGRRVGRRAGEFGGLDFVDDEEVDEVQRVAGHLGSHRRGVEDDAQSARVGGAEDVGNRGDFVLEEKRVAVAKAREDLLHVLRCDRPVRAVGQARLA